MKQTAVEWLEEQMLTWGNLPRWMRDDIVEKSKAMEKEQIEDAFEYGWSARNAESMKYGKQYYSETYGKETL